MKKLLVVCLFSLGVFSSLKANNIAVSNVTLKNINKISDYVSVAFDMNWENSFRNSSGTGNWDAAWVFVKYKIGATGEWKHATLNTTGHTIPSLGASTQTDGTGIFLYRNTTGNGTFTLNGVELRWNYGTDGVPDESKIYVKVFAIEMIYIPEESFYVGSGGQTDNGNYKSNDGEFRQANDVSSTGLATTFLINSTPPTIQGNNISSNINNLTAFNGINLDLGTTTGTASLASGFPTGYYGFYAMKYEITQGQYSDFLNTLTYNQQEHRITNSPGALSGTGAFDSPGSYRNSIEISSSGKAVGIPALFGCDLNNNDVYNESSDGNWIACNYISWQDLTAFLDWAALRPLTELEYEKICRGPLSPVQDEYPWGNTIIKGIGNILNAGQPNETSNTNGANTNMESIFTDGPLRVGIFATSTSNRKDAGSSYYGAMEMGGNVWEQLIGINSSVGRNFSGTPGNGILDSNGDANTTDWPDYTGSILRGGSWAHTVFSLRTSDRLFELKKNELRLPDYGGRGGR